MSLSSPSCVHHPERFVMMASHSPNSLVNSLVIRRAVAAVENKSARMMITHLRGERWLLALGATRTKTLGNPASQSLNSEHCDLSAHIKWQELSPLRPVGCTTQDGWLLTISLLADKSVLMPFNERSTRELTILNHSFENWSTFKEF